MQERYALVRATVRKYTLSAVIPKKTSLPYGHSDESDGGPPSPKKIDATELKIDESLQKLLRYCLFLYLFILD